MKTLKDNELIYVYAFLPEEQASEEKVVNIQGIDTVNNVEIFNADGLAAAVCRVSESEFAEANFKKNVEDMVWLQEKAYHHHDLMNSLHDQFTILPLKFGTIFENDESLKNMMNDYKGRMQNLLREVDGKEEWNLKIFADRGLYSEKVLKNNPAIEEKRQEIASLSKGKQFFARKKLEQFAQTQIQREIDLKCENVHNNLVSLSSNYESKKNWEKKVTGRDDEMTWNCVYLIETGEKVSNLKKAVEEFQNKSDSEKEGLRFELTGPWPAYHFSDFKKKTAGDAE